MIAEEDPILAAVKAVPKEPFPAHGWEGPPHDAPAPQDDSDPILNAVRAVPSVKAGFSPRRTVGKGMPTTPLGSDSIGRAAGVAAEQVKAIGEGVGSGLGALGRAPGNIAKRVVGFITHDDPEAMRALGTYEQPGIAERGLQAAGAGAGKSVAGLDVPYEATQGASGFSGDVLRAGAQMAPAMAAGALGGPAAAASVFGAQGAGQAAEEADNSSASPAGKALYTFFEGALNAALGAGGAAGQAEKALAGKLGAGGVKHLATELTKQAMLMGGAQEATNAAKIATGVDPNVSMRQGVPEAAALGGTLAGLMHAVSALPRLGFEAKAAPESAPGSGETGSATSTGAAPPEKETGIPEAEASAVSPSTPGSAEPSHDHSDGSRDGSPIDLPPDVQEHFAAFRKSAGAPNAEPVEPRDGVQADVADRLGELGVRAVFVRGEDGEQLPRARAEQARGTDLVFLDANLPDEELAPVALYHELTHVLQERSPETAASLDDLIKRIAPELSKASESDAASRIREARKGGLKINAREALADERPAYATEALGRLAEAIRSDPERAARVLTGDYGMWQGIKDAIVRTLRAVGLSDRATAFERDVAGILGEAGVGAVPKGLEPRVAMALARKTAEMLDTLKVVPEARPKPFKRSAPKPEPHTVEEAQRQFVEAMNEGLRTEQEVRAEQKRARAIVPVGEVKSPKAEARISAAAERTAKRSERTKMEGPSELPPTQRLTGDRYGDVSGFKSRDIETDLAKERDFEVKNTTKVLRAAGFKEPEIDRYYELRKEARATDGAHEKALLFDIQEKMRKRLTPEQRADLERTATGASVDELEAFKAAKGERDRDAMESAGAARRMSLPRVTKARESTIKAAAKKAEREGEDTGVGQSPGPLAQTATGPKSRAFARGVREARGPREEIVTLNEQAGVADEMLSADYAGTKEKILAKSRRGDALTAAETLATADIKNRLTLAALRSKTPEAMKEATRWEWIYQDARREAARSLGVIRDALRPRSGAEEIGEALASPGKYIREKRAAIQKELAKKDLPDARRFALNKDLADLEDQAARENLRGVQALAKAGLDPTLLASDYFADQYTFSRAARIVSTSKGAGLSRAWDWLMEYERSSVLSGLATPDRKAMSDVVHFSYEGLSKRIAEAVVNTAVRNPDAASLGEVAAYMRAFLPGLAHGGKNFLMALRTEMPVFEQELARRGVDIGGDARSILTVEGASRAAIPGPLGEGIRAPLRLLLAQDEFAKTFVAHAEASGLAYRAAKKEGLSGAAFRERMGEILDDPSNPAHADVWKRGLEAGRKTTFQDKPNPDAEPFASWTLTSIMKGRSTFRIGPIKPLEPLLLFVQTPFRIFQRGTGVPLHPLVMVSKLVNGRYGGNQPALIRDAGTLGLSVGISMAIANAVAKKDEDGLPFITGSRPWNPGEKALQTRTVPPYSIRIGNEYWAYNQLEPAGVAVATTVDAAHAYMQHVEKESGSDAASSAFVALFKSVFDQAKDKTYLKTLGDVMTAIEAPEGSKTARLVRDTMVTPFVPNILRSGLRADQEDAISDNVRKHEGESSWPSAWRSIPGEAMPGVLGAPPTLRYDLWGREIKQNGRSWLARFASPVKVTGEAGDIMAVDKYLVRYNDAVDAGKLPDARRWFPAPPDATYKVGKETHYLSDAQYADLQHRGGEEALKAVSRMRLAQEPNEKEIDRIRETINSARDRVRREILRKP